MSNALRTLVEARNRQFAMMAFQIIYYFITFHARSTVDTVESQRKKQKTSSLEML
jgi:hypothetical protein